MANQQLRVLYLSNAFPPGVSGRFPGLCASSHPQETRMTQALARLVEVSSVGLLPGKLWGRLEPVDPSLGLDHKLLLWERKPEPWHRWRSLRRLCAFYSEEVELHGVPDILLVRNLSNVVYNYFVRWLRRQPRRPIIVTVLADSGLGQPVSTLRRWRYKIKPMQVLEETAVNWYDACLGFGIDSRRHFEPRGAPWLWMPAAFNFYFEPPPASGMEGPIQFGYFGGLAEAIGVLSMIQAFLTSGVSGSLRICGFGGLTDAIKKLAAEHPNLHFDGVKSQTECLVWAQQMDVLVNPRIPFDGWDNSFPSKLFEYGVTGKAVLSTRACGVDQILQEAGLYIDDCTNLEDSLRRQFQIVSAMSREDLQQRGSVIRQRIVNEYNWDAQARRIIGFLEELIGSGKFPFLRR
jgi:glycosyltransferase involved in cell wall biosynthesis